MRRLLLIALFVTLTVVLGTAGTHRHSPGDPKNECTQCVFAQQGVTPAPAAVAPVPLPVAPLHVALRSVAVHRIDGRHLYLFAPKVSPPLA